MAPDTSDHRFISDAVLGCAEADEFLRSINPCMDPDTLVQRLARAAGAAEPTPRLMGFARRLQKRLERDAI